MKFGYFRFLLPLLAVAFVPAAFADTIVYTLTDTADVILLSGANETSLSNTNVTLSLTSDTASVFRGNVIGGICYGTLCNSGTATVTVNGSTYGFAAALAEQVYVFDISFPSRPTSSEFGFTETFPAPGITGEDILDAFSPTFLTYDLASSLGPTTGEFAAAQTSFDFKLTNGDFILIKNPGLAPVVSVTVASVPEPASLLLLGSGLIGLASRRFLR